LQPSKALSRGFLLKPFSYKVMTISITILVSESCYTCTCMLCHGAHFMLYDLKFAGSSFEVAVLLAKYFENT